MIILELNIDHFGKLKKRQISFRPGTNIISGNNETGKTTIASFIKAMLYGLNEGEEEYLHFFPRAYEGAFGGSMKVLENGRFYEIRRELSGAKRGLFVRELTSGLDEEDPEAFLKKLVGGMDRAAYEATGFIGANSFGEDVEKYRETEEKHREAKREEDIRNRFFNARAELKKQRDDCQEKTDDTLEGKRVLLDRRKAEVGEKLKALEEALPEAKSRLDEMTKRLTEDEARVRQQNEAREEGLRQEMVAEKERLAEHIRGIKKSAKHSRAAGVALMVAGILAGLAAWFYMTSYAVGILDFSHPHYLVSVLLAGGGIVLFLAGLIVTISVAVKKKAEEKRLKDQNELNDAVEKAEKKYQNYLDHRDEYDDQVPEEEERKAAIGTLSGEVEQLGKEEAETARTMEEIEKEDGDLAAREEKDREYRKNLRAMDLSLATFDRVGRLNENEDFNEFSAAATEFYRSLLPERPAVIHVKNEMITVELKESGRHLLSQLSTGTMHETLIAVRLAKLWELDPEKRLPLILDDVFSNFDETRLAAAMEFLRRTGRQAILFSCQQAKTEENQA